jgi:hypothetical protein
MTWSPEDSAEGTEYTFAGVKFNHASHTVCLGQKTHEKVKRAKVAGLPATYGEFEEQFSRMMYVAAILGWDLVRDYFFMKFGRRHLAKLATGEMRSQSLFEWSTSARRTWELWLSWAELNTPRRPAQTVLGPADYVMFTDSSLKGFGVVLLNVKTGELHVFGGPYEQESDNINASEVRAVTIGFERFKHVIAPGSRVLVLVDNTSVIAGVHNRNTHSEALAQQFTSLFEVMRAAGVAIAVDYICTGINVADDPSRFRYLSARKVRDSLDYAFTVSVRNYTFPGQNHGQAHGW